jgi:hypothetical protein
MNAILSVLLIFGDDISPSQLERLMDACRGLSIADREALLNDPVVIGSPFYTLLSQNMVENRGFSRY